MSGARRTDYQRNRILEAFASGRSVREIASHFGCKNGYPASLARRAGWPERPKNFVGTARDAWLRAVARLMAGRSMAAIVILSLCGAVALAVASYRGPAPVTTRPVIDQSYIAKIAPVPKTIALPFEERWPGPKAERLLDPEPLVPIKVRTESVRMETAEVRTAQPEEAMPVPRSRPRFRPKAHPRPTGETRDVCARHGMRTVWTIKRHWKSWRCRR